MEKFTFPTGEQVHKLWTSKEINDRAEEFQIKMQVIDEQGYNKNLSAKTLIVPKSLNRSSVWPVRDANVIPPMDSEPVEYVFNWLESAFPETLNPVPQTTVEREGAYSREYSGTNVSIKAKDSNLYFMDSETLHNLGTVNYWYKFARSEILFNWLEKQPQVSELLSPSPQTTHIKNGLFYRCYPQTNTCIGTKGGFFQFKDAKGKVHDSGLVDNWLKNIE